MSTLKLKRPLPAWRTTIMPGETQDRINAELYYSNKWARRCRVWGRIDFLFEQQQRRVTWPKQWVHVNLPIPA
jgi:hypothetical protein